jgi:hypothetical protein
MQNRQDTPTRQARNYEKKKQDAFDSVRKYDAERVEETHFSTCE